MEHRKSLLCSHGDTWFGVSATRALLRSGDFKEVVVGVTDPTNELSRALEREGAKICHWDLCDVESIQSSLQGIQIVLLIPSPGGDMVKQTCNLITAIERSHIRHCLLWSCAFLYSNAFRPPVSGCPNLAKGQRLVKLAKESEQKFLESRIDFKCIFRSKGILPLATGRGKFAPLDMKDIGVASAHILAKNIPDEHRRQIYTFTGSQLVTGQELVEYANKPMNGTLTFKDTSFEEMKGLLDRLVSEKEMTNFEADLILYLNYLIRENCMAIQTDDLKTLLKREPVTIEGFFEENKNAFRPGLSRFFNRWVLSQ